MEQLNNFISLPIDKLVIANWNYKIDDNKKAKKLANNLKRNGQVENIIVRELETGFFEVVNGNHRLLCMQKLQFKNVFCYNLGIISIQEAKRIAVETNETKFDTDPLKLAEIFDDIKSVFPIEDLIDTMPFAKSEIDDLATLLDSGWSNFDVQEVPTKQEEVKNTTEFILYVKCNNMDDLEELRERLISEGFECDFN